MLETDTQAPPETPAEPEPRGRTWLIVGLVVVLALFVGGAVGWWLGSEDEGTSDVVTVDGTELTERQQDMADMTGAFWDAWVAGDGDAAAELMTSAGVVDYVEWDGELYRVSDGSLQAHIAADGEGWPNLIVSEPMLVADDYVLVKGEVGRLDWVSIVKFMPSGLDPLIRYSAIVWN